MKWSPSPPNLLKTFDEVAPPPPVVRKKMFGYPAAFVNGNMFLGLFQDQMILRLPEQAREHLIRKGGALFEPMPGGRCASTSSCHLRSSETRKAYPAG